MPYLTPNYCIQIDFDKNSENPARVFQTMMNLIKAFEDFDKDLFRSIDNKIEPVIILEDIEAGSIKTWLANVIKNIPDESLKDLDWKKGLGHFAVKAKYIIINKLEGKTKITDGQIIEDIQYEIVEEAKKVDKGLLPNESPMPLPTLIKNIKNIQDATEPLNNKDKMFFKSGEGDATFNLELKIQPEEIEDLVTKERISNDSTMILKIKKPDYLGSSMWEMKHGSSAIDVKLTDKNWLDEFHNRRVNIRPGDSLRAKVKIEVKYGHNLEPIGTSYEIIEVIEVIEARTSDSQQKLGF